MKPTRILLVDPQPVVCAGLRSLIGSFGPEWEICGSAGDGLGVARELRKRLRRVEMLIFSGVTSGVQLGRIWRSAVRGCLLKSEGSEVLALALESVRAGHAFRSRAISALCQSDEPNGKVPSAITARETEVLHLICEGKSTKEVATRLGVSPKTIETHRSHLLRKLRVRSSLEMTRFAIAEGLVVKV